MPREMLLPPIVPLASPIRQSSRRILDVRRRVLPYASHDLHDAAPVFGPLAPEEPLMILQQVELCALRAHAVHYTGQHPAG
jgi:hypothetical protein